MKVYCNSKYNCCNLVWVHKKLILGVAEVESFAGWMTTT